MLKSKIDNFTKDICTYNEFSEEQTEEIQYVIKIVILEIIKMMVVAFLFSIIGYMKEVFMIILTMVCIKPFTGGYHEDSQRKCLISTIILVSFILIINENTHLNMISIIALNLINLFSVYHQAPIINSDMPITKEDLLKKNRNIAMTNSIIFLIISLILYNQTYTRVITWTLVTNVCLMFNSKYRG